MIEKYIVTVGDIVADFLVQIPALPVTADSLVFAQDMRLEPGGTANFLIAASRLGVPPKAVGVLGLDHWGDQVAEILQDEAVDLTHVVRQGSTTLVTVLVDAQGHHAFVGKFGEGDELSVTEAHRQLVDNAAALFVTGYSLNEERLRGLTMEMMAMAQETAVSTSSTNAVSCHLDLGPSFARLPKAQQISAIKASDVLFMTEEEIPAYLQGKVTELFAYGPEIIIVKKGRQGCVAFTATEEFVIPGFSVPVLDTTAAGDSFAAGFIVARLQGKSLVEAAWFANVVGAVTVQKLGGGRNVATLAEVKQSLKE